MKNHSFIIKRIIEFKRIIKNINQQKRLLTKSWWNHHGTLLLENHCRTSSQKRFTVELKNRIIVGLRRRRGL